jgi:outer membrane protein OmpA-like peptidoglycan-associated protein
MAGRFGQDLMRRIAPSLLCGLLLANPALAAPLTLDLPQPATQTLQLPPEASDLLLPSGPFADGTLPGTLLPGRISQSAWRIDQPLATIDLMQRLRADVIKAGFVVTFECKTADCGGFDFRFALPVLAEPDMHVDLGDFRFLAARRSAPGGGDEAVTLLVSRSQAAAYVQITLLGPQVAAPVTVAAASAATGAEASGGDGAVSAAPLTPDASATPAPPVGDVVATLMAKGGTALDDLTFASGKAALEPGTYASLAALTAWLLANPDRKIALVGHTDASGGLAANVALSKARAAAVRQVLIAAGVPAAQVEAQGVGFLAPRATNLTDDGRRQNRRVEVILTSTP